jgi:hypothetical protein
MEEELYYEVKLSEVELRKIIASLSEYPYKDVAILISAITIQVDNIDF